MKKLFLFLVAGILISCTVSAQCTFNSVITAGGPVTFCPGGSVTLATSLTGTYLWNTGANTQSIVVTTAGDYYVDVTQNGCTARSNMITVSNAPYWLSISCGESFVMALRSDGTLWTWGCNNSGQLGVGTTINHLSPVEVGTDNDWVSVACGSSHTLALKSNGSLWAWGSNFFGSLGTGDNNDRHNPTRVGTDNDWASIACGSYHSMALKTGKTLWTWGNNIYGQLGNGSNTNTNQPGQVTKDVDWSSITCGYYHSLALKSGGTLWLWGSNDYGQLGDGTITSRNIPASLGSATDWVSASCGQNFTLMIKSDSTMWGWGDNSNGQLGNSMHNAILSPIQVGTAKNWSSVSCGSTHSLGVKGDKTLWAWGFNQYGDLGDGTNTVFNDVPTAIAGQTGVRIAKGGGWFSAIVKTNRTLVCLTGDNTNGQIGDTSTKSRNTFKCSVSSVPLIITQAISPLSYCAGANIVIQYMTNNNFCQGDVFFAELSDMNGSFANPVRIGRVMSLASGSINGIISANTPAGQAYRIRVVDSCYLVKGRDNGSNITINTGPKVAITPQTASICSGTLQTLTASGAATYIWSNGLGTGSTKTVTPVMNSTYSVNGTDNNGCANSASASIAVKPAVMATANPNPICRGQNTLISASGSTSTYSWNNGIGHVQSKTVAPYATTTYSVTGTTTNGCTNQASVIVTVNSTPSVSISSSLNNNVKGGYNLTAKGATTYVWSNNLGTGNSVVVAPTTTTTYSVTGTTNGCTASSSIQVRPR